MSNCHEFSLSINQLSAQEELVTWFDSVIVITQKITGLTVIQLHYNIAAKGKQHY